MKLTLQKAIEVLKNRDKYASSTLERAAKYILERRTSRSVTSSLLTLAQKLTSKASNHRLKADTTKVSHILSSSTPVATISSGANMNNGTYMKTLENKVDEVSIAAGSDRKSLFDALNPINKPRKVFELLFGKYKQSGWFQYLFIVWLFIWFCFSVAFLARIAFIFSLLNINYEIVMNFFRNANLKDYFSWVKDWNIIPYNPEYPITGIYKTMAESNPISGEYHRNIDQKEYEINRYNEYIERTRKLNEILEEYRKIPKAPNSENGISTYYYDMMEKLKDKYQQGAQQYERYGLYKQYYDTYQSWKGFFNRWVGYPLQDIYEFFTTYEGFCYLLAFGALLYGGYALLCYYDVDMATVLAGMATVAAKIYSGAKYVVTDLCHLDSAFFWIQNKVSSLFSNTGLFGGVNNTNQNQYPDTDIIVDWTQNMKLNLTRPTLKYIYISVGPEGGYRFIFNFYYEYNNKKAIIKANNPVASDRANPKIA